MTIEEKAKAYDNALEVMRQWSPCNDNDQLEALKKAAFPELGESEDERIRKHLVAIVEMYWGKTNDPDKAKDLAYLERLKEQKHKFNVGDTIRLKNSYAEYTIKHIWNGRYYCNGCSIDIDGCDRDYELVQQKPAWSEEDEKIWKSLLRDYEYAMQGSGTVWGKEFEKKYNWLKSLRPSWKPSEEQMNGLAHAINLDVYDAKRYGLDSLYNDLKKLI